MKHGKKDDLYLVTKHDDSMGAVAFVVEMLIKAVKCGMCGFKSRPPLSSKLFLEIFLLNGWQVAGYDLDAGQDRYRWL